MISGCMTGANFTMLADVYVPHISQDSKTKEIVNSWVFDRTIKCYATSIETDSASDAASGKKFNDRYREYELIKIHTTQRLSKRTRLSAIRNAKGNVVWVEPEREDAPTVFEVQGATAYFDPFGLVLKYEVMCRRVEVQDGV
jgi:hypothetical protein